MSIADMLESTIEDERLVDAAERKAEQPERHMVTMPSEVKKAICYLEKMVDAPEQRGSPLFDAADWAHVCYAKWNIPLDVALKLGTIIGWVRARKCAGEG